MKVRNIAWECPSADENNADMWLKNVGKKGWEDGRSRVDLRKSWQRGTFVQIYAFACMTNVALLLIAARVFVYPARISPAAPVTILRNKSENLFLV